MSQMMRLPYIETREIAIRLLRYNYIPKLGLGGVPMQLLCQGPIP